MAAKQLRTILFTVLAAFFLIAMACAQNENGMAKPAQPTPNSNNSMNRAASQTSGSAKSLSAHDQQFLETLAKSSEGEVTLGKLVEQKTTNPQVKEFAQRMVHDHSILDAQAKRIMSQFGLQPPPPMTTGQQQLHAQLLNESGKQLDNTYMQAQIKEHEKDLSEITPEAQQGEKLQPSDPTVSELAEEARPVVLQHLQLAQTIAKEIGANPTQSAMSK